MFSEWDLPGEIIEGLAGQGITEPTPVQAEAWSHVLEGRDLLVQSRTGTGKTLAYGLPILRRLERGPGPVEALVVLPTRELAMQVGANLGRLTRTLGSDVAVLYGGGSYTEQLHALRHGARIVVGTPGRLCDHLERQTLKLEGCRTLVLDEADEILDLGFAEELEKVMAALPAERQTLLFSATLPPEMVELSKKSLRDPHRLSLSSGLTAAPEIVHAAYLVDRPHRSDALVNVLHAEQPALALVFCHTRAETEEVAERLRSEGLRASALHGDMAQGERSRTLGSFRRRHLNVLVATDVAARGIDVRGLSHVVNLGVPQAAETYIHRVGRTGRAGEKGLAITFVAPRDAARFRRTLHSAGIALEVRPVPQAEDVRKRLRERYHAIVCERVAAGTDSRLKILASELLGYVEPADLVAALLEGDPAARAAVEAGLEVPVPRASGAALGGVAGAGEGRRPGPGGFKGRPAADAGGRAGAPRGMRRIQVNHGQSQHMTASRLVRLVCESSGLQSDALGAILVLPQSCFVDVREAEANRVAKALCGAFLNGRRMKARVV